MLKAYALYFLSGALLLVILALLKFVGLKWQLRLWDKNPQSALNASKEGEFICQPADLVAPIDPEQAEVNSYVQDPLGRVPNQPFGHLHLGWSQLLSYLEPQDTLWRFNSPKRSDKVACAGLAVLRKNKVIAEFIYERHLQ